MASLVKKYGWHEWLCHTNFSFLIGASHPRQLIERAVECEYNSLAITDYDGVYGVARAFRDLRAFKKESSENLGFEADKIALKLNYGAEIHFEKDHTLPIYFQNTLVLMATSHAGYGNLCKLLTYAHREGKKDANIPVEYFLSQNLDDLVAIVPMRGVIRRKEGQDLKALAQRYGKLKDAFGSRFYFALSRHLSAAEDKWLQPTSDLAAFLGCQTLFSQDIFFHSPAQKRLSDVLHAIRNNKCVQDVSDHLFINSARCPKSVDSLERIYSRIPNFELILKNSKMLSETFSFELSELKYTYPQEMIPEGMTAQLYLTELVWSSAHKVYGTGLPPKIQGLLHHELTLVQHLNFADYFLTVFDIVRWAREQNILCQGRGSAANSAICFVLGITSVNPNNFDLLFERFLSIERGDPPDIDVDFEHERREEVIQYIYERYGRHRAAMVANVITFRSKGSARFVGKALGVPENILTGVSTIMHSRAFRSSGVAEAFALVKEENLKLEEPVSLPDHTWELWIELAKELKGFPRHLGIHSGGFVLSDLPLNLLCPQEPATMPGRTVITWCKEDIEGLGFFKVDILALGMLTAIRKCLDILHTHYGKSLTLASIPPEDPQTYAMIQKADTIGTFQIESRAQMSFLPRHKPCYFYDLVVQVAIVRPGPIQGGMIHPYLKRRNGLEPVSFPDERLEPILKRTFGIPIFQEQVMRVAIAVGGFSAGEANELRKHIGSFTLKNKSSEWVQKLADGMKKNGISDSFSSGLIGQIKGFSSYGFPESHAASFALLAYASSYLKCHFPAAFFTSLLNSQPMGFYDLDTIIKTIQRLGIKILPLCILKSNWDHTLERIEEGKGEGLNIYAVRMGMRIVSCLGKKAITALVDKRNTGADFSTLGNFLKNNRLSRTDLTALAATNALRVYGLTRKDALWLAEASPFSELLEEGEDQIPFPTETEIESVQLDYHATGTSLGKHPAALFRTYSWLFPIPVSNLKSSVGVKNGYQGQEVWVFGMVSCRQSPPTAKGMLFITMWDELGSFDLVVRPITYAAFRQQIDGMAFLCVKAKVQAQDGARSLLVTTVLEPIEQSATVVELAAKETQKTTLPLVSHFDEVRANSGF